MRYTGKPAGIWFAVFILILNLSACTGPKKPLLIEPSFGAFEVKNVVLLPVVFNDSSLERYYQIRIGEEIRYHAEKKLEEKGYAVTLVDKPGKESYWVSYVLPEGGIDKLVELAPEGTDALVVIWVDHFLDRTLYGRDAQGSLDIYATASMVSTQSGGEIWRDEGVGKSMSSMIWGMEWFEAPAELADSLFATLPAAGP